MKALNKMFRELPLRKRIQFVAASVLSGILLTAIPVSAWFVSQRRIIKLQKIQAPNMLILSAAQREDKMFFEIDGINGEENQLYYCDVNEDGIIDMLEDTPKFATKTDPDNSTENVKIMHKDYVFCVTGDSLDSFNIQLAHTTNNPFEYQIFAAKEYGSFSELNAATLPQPGDEVNYVTYTVNGVPAKLLGIDEKLQTAAENDPTLNYHKYSKDAIVYYAIDTSCKDTSYALNANNEKVYTGEYDGTYVNPESGAGSNTPLKASNSDGYFNHTYEKGKTTYSNVQENAIPLYWQKMGIQAYPGSTNSNKQPFSRHFILRISWKKNALKNAENETDIVYLTVKANNNN